MCDAVWMAIVPAQGPAFVACRQLTMAALVDEVGCPLIREEPIAPDVTAWINDIGPQMRLPRNERVMAERDRILRVYSSGLPICGTAVLVGTTDPSTGLSTHLPERWRMDMDPDGRLGWCDHPQSREVLAHLAQVDVPWDVRTASAPS